MIDSTRRILPEVCLAGNVTPSPTQKPFCGDLRGNRAPSGASMLTPLPNESGDPGPEALLPNIGEVEEGKFFIPFGKYKHSRGLQIFDQAAGQKVLAYMENVRKDRGRHFRGFPIYIGHPDVDRTKYPDARAYGWIEGGQLLNDGLLLNDIKWSPAGETLIQERAYLFFSPYFGGEKMGRGQLRPIELYSVGLTNTPNIKSVHPIANDEGGGDPSKTKTTLENTMNEWLKNLLKKLGLNEGQITALENEAENAMDVDAIVAQAKTTLGITQLENDLSTTQGERDSAKNERDTLTQERDTLKTSLANERTARIEAEVDLGVAETRIRPTEREGLVTRLKALENDDTLSGEFKTLRERRPTLNRQARDHRQDKPKAGSQDRVALINEKVETVKATEGLAHQQAWAKVKRENPDLFKHDQGKDEDDA